MWKSALAAIPSLPSCWCSFRLEIVGDIRRRYLLAIGRANQEVLPLGLLEEHHAPISYIVLLRAIPAWSYCTIPTVSSDITIDTASRWLGAKTPTTCRQGRASRTALEIHSASMHWPEIGDIACATIDVIDFRRVPYRLLILFKTAFQECQAS